MCHLLHPRDCGIAREEQKQLALHVIHIIPRLQDSNHEVFLVSYDQMSEDKLEKMVTLIGEPARCWRLMKFDLTLTRKLPQDFQSNPNHVRRVSSKFQHQPNPTNLILRYTDRSCREQDYTELPHLSEIFRGLGSPS
ncbi:hypothetical protein EJ08DRAFT_99308 [Tothia fuscella]|uniref:Uncharacterized protein n=1 Tax=Tothia fuscella TaxID=1048955 RepID=A0A9P4TS13_9PEZI|nr:hypothetical protein EJ08DRAFT_99308 [Tothia fuscella]